MTENEQKSIVAALERIARVLGALYASNLGDLEQGIKAERLSRCGFANTEIADLLGTSPNTVNVGLHKLRRGKKVTKVNKRKMAKM
jgi:CRP-like cAMP-binding protein